MKDVFFQKVLYLLRSFITIAFKPVVCFNVDGM